MTTIRTRVLPGGRIEITDPALREGAEVVVVVSSPSGDGASSHVATPEAVAPEAQAVPPARRMPLDEDGLPIPAVRDPDRAYTLVDMIGAAPSGRTAEEVDRDLRDLRSEWDERCP